MTSLTLTPENLQTEWLSIEHTVKKYGAVKISIQPVLYLETDQYHSEDREIFSSMQDMLTDLELYHSHPSPELCG